MLCVFFQFLFIVVFFRLIMDIFCLHVCSALIYCMWEILNAYKRSFQPKDRRNPRYRLSLCMNFPIFVIHYFFHSIVATLSRYCCYHFLHYQFDSICSTSLFYFIISLFIYVSLSISLYIDIKTGRIWIFFSMTKYWPTKKKARMGCSEKNSNRMFNYNFFIAYGTTLGYRVPRYGSKRCNEPFEP